MVIEMEPNPPQREVKAWVFQANPKYFDLDQYLSRHTYIYWSCPQFASQVQAGMPMFLKKSGPGGGMVAKGTIAEMPVPADRIRHPEFLREDLWQPGSSRAPNRPRVGIVVDEVRLTADDGMIPTSRLGAIPELERHPLVTVRRGTIFRLSAAHAVGLMREWGNRGLSDQTIPVAREGARVLVTHLRIERDSKLVRDKKDMFRREHGRLFCELCQAAFSHIYGSSWDECAVEEHHLRPLGELAEACMTTLDDLLLVCGTCHRLIHRSQDVEENVRLLRRQFEALPPR